MTQSKIRRTFGGQLAQKNPGRGRALKIFILHMHGFEPPPKQYILSFHYLMG